MAKRRRFSAEFKARVAIKALVGDQTLAELAKKHSVHPNMISAWKRQAQEGLPDIFSRGVDADAADKEAEIKRLHEKIGQLVCTARKLTQGNAWKVTHPGVDNYSSGESCASLPVCL